MRKAHVYCTGFRFIVLIKNSSFEFYPQKDAWNEHVSNSLSEISERKDLEIFQKKKFFWSVKFLL